MYSGGPFTSTTGLPEPTAPEIPNASSRGGARSSITTTVAPISTATSVRSNWLAASAHLPAARARSSTPVHAREAAVSSSWTLHALWSCRSFVMKTPAYRRGPCFSGTDLAEGLKRAMTCSEEPAASSHSPVQREPPWSAETEAPASLFLAGHRIATCSLWLRRPM
jgi:hypothetical protein